MAGLLAVDCAENTDGPPGSSRPLPRRVCNAIRDNWSRRFELQAGS
jgi:hypothetical protein